MCVTPVWPGARCEGFGCVDRSVPVACLCLPLQQVIPQPQVYSYLYFFIYSSVVKYIVWFCSFLLEYTPTIYNMSPVWLSYVYFTTSYSNVLIDLLLYTWMYYHIWFPMKCTPVYQKKLPTMVFGDQKGTIQPGTAQSQAIELTKLIQTKLDRFHSQYVIWCGGESPLLRVALTQGTKLKVSLEVGAQRTSEGNY